MPFYPGSKGGVIPLLWEVRRGSEKFLSKNLLVIDPLFIGRAG